MPELPEVEAVCRKLRGQVVGRRILSVDLRRCAAPAVATVAPGRRILGVERRGKHILLHLSRGFTLHVHLRMSGNLYVMSDGRLPAGGYRVLMRLGGRPALVFEDPRALARMAVIRTAELDALLPALGLEPLSRAFTVARFRQLAAGSRRPAKLFLMDQGRIAGLGNIYAAEALFRAGVSPRRAIGRLRPDRIEKLHAAIREVVREAVDAAVRAYAGPGEFASEENFPMAVYGREGEPCLVCGRRVRRITQGGRSTYYCPGCQS